MGSMMTASCKKCGFERIFNFGAGMQDFETVCKVPAIHTSSGEFMVRNIFAAGKKKSDYRFYNEPDMYKGKIKGYELSWGKINLKANRNFCPQCHSFTLEFRSVGHFD